MKINDIELELDIYNADTAQRYENAVVLLQSVPKPTQGEKLSDNIRAQCGMVYQFFDLLFGEGTAQRVFGQTDNLSVCIDAVTQVANCVDAQKQAFLKKTGAFKAPNEASS